MEVTTASVSEEDGDVVVLLSDTCEEYNVPAAQDIDISVILQKLAIKAHTHWDEYRRALFASVFQRVFCVHTQAIFTDDEPSEHANSFPDIRWRLM